MRRGQNPIDTQQQVAWVPRDNLEQWLSDYAPSFYSFFDRRKFVRVIKNVIELTGSTGKRVFRATFAILDERDHVICHITIDDMLSDDGLAFEQAFAEALQMSSTVGNFDYFARINAARLHISRIMASLMKFDEYEPTGKTPFHKIFWPTRHRQYGRYGEKWVETFEKEFLRKLRLKRQRAKILKERYSVIASARKEKAAMAKRDEAVNDVDEGSATARCVELDTDIVVAPVTPEPQVVYEQMPRFEVPLYAGCSTTEKVDIERPEIPMKAGRNVTVREQLIAPYTPEEVPAKYVDKQTTWVEEPPCIQVVNSAVKAIAGYASVQIGGKVDPHSNGKYFDETNLSDLSKDLKSWAEGLKRKGIRHVLISGTIYGPNSKFSATALNSMLPKAFDGMVIKMVANAKYGHRVASKVRERLGMTEYHDPDYERDVTRFFDDLKDFKQVYSTRTKVEVPLTVEYDNYADLHMLQMVYNLAYPNSCDHDQYQKFLDFQTHQFNEPMTEIRAKYQEGEFVDTTVFAKPTYLTPVLQTHLEHRHPVNQQELCYSVFNRNYMPTKESTTIVSKDAAAQLLENFVDVFKRRNIELPQIDVSDMCISEYIDKKGVTMVREISRLLEDHEKEIDFWDALVKGVSKPTLEDTNVEMTSPTQVIVCKDKLYNAFFGPFLSKLKDFVVKNLPEYIFIFSDASVDKLEDKITRSKEIFEGYYSSEIDISKYDKSQGLTSFLYECMMFKRFGMPDHLLMLWVNSHWFAKIKSITGTAKFSLPLQRKSGDPWTFMGNTLYLLAILLTLYGSRARYIMVAGDDSRVYGIHNTKFDREVCEKMSRDYNLDAKFIVCESAYFCSRFLVKLWNRYYLVPDPIKFLIKLGKKDVRDRGHLEDLRISFCDQIDCYKYKEIRQAVAKAASDRYQCEMIEKVMEHCFSLVTDRLAFNNAFVDSEHATKMAIIVPPELEIKLDTKKAIFHDDLVRKQTKKMDMPQLDAYMRAIGKNAGKKILITFKEEFVPQDTRVIGRFDAESFSLGKLLNLIKDNYRN